MTNLATAAPSTICETMGQGRVELPTSRLSVSTARHVTAGQLDTYGGLERTPSGQLDESCPVAVQSELPRKLPPQNEKIVSSFAGHDWDGAA